MLHLLISNVSEYKLDKAQQLLFVVLISPSTSSFWYLSTSLVYTFFAWSRPPNLRLEDAINFDAPDFPKKKAHVVSTQIC